MSTSRTGAVVRGVSGRAPGGSRTVPATTTAVTSVEAASAANTVGTPPAAASGGSARAPAAAPSGTDVCRTAIASPRRWWGNQVSTARPLAALTDAPEAPASASRTPAATGSSTRTAAPRAAAAPTSPTVITDRSPKRSAAIPHGTRVGISPADTAPTSRPTPARSRPKWSRSAGVTAAIPRKCVAVAAWASVPAASTTQR